MNWWRGKKPAPAQTGGGATGGGGAFAQALQLHQAGRIKEAEAIYRQIVAADPKHFDATHLLGVAALQSGRLDEAARTIEKALKLNPGAAAAHNNLGNVYLRQGRHPQALQAFQRAVAAQEDYADAHFNLGLAHAKQGDVASARRHLQRVLALNPRNAAAHNQLGSLAYEAGDHAAAQASFQAAVKADAQFAEGHANLAMALVHAGDEKAAQAAYERALALNPKLVGALVGLGTLQAQRGHFDKARDLLNKALLLEPAAPQTLTNLGNVLRDQGEWAQALPYFDKALQAEPRFAPAHLNAALALRDLGRADEAAARNRRALELDPKLAQAHCNLGLLALDRRAYADAAAHLQAARALDENDAEIHYNLGSAAMGRADARAARPCYVRALALRPEYPEARWSLAMAQLPPIFDSVAELPAVRAAFEGELIALEAWFDARRATRGDHAVGVTQPFYLAYHDEDNRPLLARYGALCARLMAAWRTHKGLRPPAKGGHLPIRVGIVSAHVRSHSVWNAILKGWVENLDPARFELHVFHLGQEADAETARVQARAKRFESGRRDVLRWTQAIAQSAPDILIYPEIGMDPMTAKLAAQRIAPVQVATWGHPETTGLPTMDYYLSAEDLEAEAAQSYYTEKLVRLPHLGVCYSPLPVTPQTPDLRALGLHGKGPTLLCPGSPFKYGPQHDAVWVEIARQLGGDAQLIFFQSTPPEFAQRLAARLEKAFKAAGLNFKQQVVFIPFQPPPLFYGLMARVDVFLDTLGFSGFNTAMQAVECGLPVVAREGRFMRGRLASCLVRRMGLPELATESDADYIALAVRLGRDATYRAHIREQMVARRAVLFNDLAPVRALESFLAEVAPKPA